MNKPLILLMATALLAAASCTTSESSLGPGSSWQGDIQRWGTLREALRDGQHEGRVAVASVAREGMYGVGALEGLRGEVTIIDGDVWISEGAAERATTSRGAADAQATVLFAAEVEAWVELAVDEDVDPSVLDAYVAKRASAAGLDTSRPFPFVVEGGLRHLQLHVIGGECPIRARMLGKPMTKPAYLMHADAIDGRLVGIFAPDSSGIMCHMGSTTHMHAVLEQGGGLTGHAETVGLAKGSKLLLPRS
jgi:alpha-acetolactate decarboxylase